MTIKQGATYYISYQTFEGLKLTGKGGTILFVLSGFLKSYPILNKIPNKAAFIIVVRETHLYMFQLNSYEKLNNFSSRFLTVSNMVITKLHIYLHKMGRMA